MVFVFSDLVAVTSTALPELSFVVKGRPPVQQRPRIAWRTRRGRAPIYYDPSSRDKRVWRLSLQQELIDCGVKVVNPFFPNETQQTSNGLVLEVVFFLSRPARDFRTKNGIRVLKEDHQKYPGSKDTDNMVKFVMDAMHIVVYHDDGCVVSIVAEKRFVEAYDNQPYTTIRITKME